MKVNYIPPLPTAALPTDALPTDGSPEAQLRVVARMRRAFLSLCRCGDVLFSPYRVTTDQYALIRAVQRTPGIRQADLGSIIFAEPNTVSAMVALLEKRGILRRKHSASDRRARLVTLTAHGEMLLQRLSDDWDPMRTRLNELFSGEAGREALRILDGVHEAMQGERERLTRSPEKLGNTPVSAAESLLIERPRIRKPARPKQPDALPPTRATRRPTNSGPVHRP